MDNRRPELTKRQKEIARQKHAQEKAERKAQRHRDRAQRPEGAPEGDGEEDPDIAGIVPGPQPPLEE